MLVDLTQPPDKVSDFVFEKFPKEWRRGSIKTSSTGSIVSSVSEIIYLGVFFSRFRRFKCSIEHAKRSFYKTANSVCGKIGRIASEEVTLPLVKSKCIPILLYGLEVCELNKSPMASMDFTINRFFMSFSAPVILKLLNLSRNSLALNHE